MSRLDNITAAQLWTQFVAQKYPRETYPDGVATTIYRQVKTAFYSGFLALFDELEALEAKAKLITDKAEGKKLVADFALEIMSQEGRPLAHFETWLKDMYPDEPVHEQPREHFKTAFITAMRFGYRLCLSSGGKAIRKLQEDVVDELRRLVAA